MKRVLVLFIFLILTTGCSIERVEYKTYEDTVNKVLSYNINLSNISLEGYQYYLPKGAFLYSKSDTNSVIKYGNTKLYLYVDIVSYYYKEKNQFEVSSDSYYSKSINYNNNFGYLEITKIKSLYFVEYMYNYSKIEAYVTEDKLNDVIYTMSVILSSVSYKDDVLNSLVGDNTINYNKVQFDILIPKKDQNDYLEYDSNQVYDGDITGNIDEDKIELDDNEE